jgi:diphthamide biosynthesis protein 2
MDDADVKDVAEWVARRGFRRVALQFPDEFMGDAVPCTNALQAACGAAVSVFLLADTTFGRRATTGVSAAAQPR